MKRILPRTQPTARPTTDLKTVLARLRAEDSTDLADRVQSISATYQCEDCGSVETPRIGLTEDRVFLFCSTCSKLPR